MNDLCILQINMAKMKKYLLNVKYGCINFVGLKVCVCLDVFLKSSVMLMTKQDIFLPLVLLNF